MEIKNNQIVDFLIICLNEFCEENQIEIEKNIDKAEYRIFGGSGNFDSFTLVNFIVFVEEQIELNFNISLILTDQKAMSKRVSPFVNIKSLAFFIGELIIEKKSS